MAHCDFARVTGGLTTWAGSGAVDVLGVLGQGCPGPRHTLFRQSSTRQPSRCGPPCARSATSRLPADTETREHTWPSTCAPSRHGRPAKACTASKCQQGSPASGRSTKLPDPSSRALCRGCAATGKVSLAGVTGGALPPPNSPVAGLCVAVGA